MSAEAWENLSTLLHKERKTLAIVPEFSEFHSCLSGLSNLVVYAPLKHNFEKFSQIAIPTTASWPGENFDQVLFVPTKNKIESLALIHLGLEALGPLGHFLFSCDNESGAKSFMSQLKKLDPGLEFESKRKARFVSFTKAQLKSREDARWIDGFDYQVNEAGFVSFPGIYGWNKVDHASRLLLTTLPVLKGVGADFGSGYGYLPHQMDLSHVTQMHLLENDSRALEASRRNLQNRPQCKFHWLDIIHDQLPLPPLDFVIMNPPFHEGKEVQPDLGLGFLKRAREFLKKNGQLFLVANQFLPYEDTLISHFGRMQKVLKQDGFKVLHV